jgi:hypothetical protein
LVFYAGQGITEGHVKRCEQKKVSVEILKFIPFNDPALQTADSGFWLVVRELGLSGDL